jgi:hypothetical protein
MKRASENAKRQASRESYAENARQANVDSLRECKYPDELRMRLEALAKATRDGNRYKD